MLAGPRRSGADPPPDDPPRPFALLAALRRTGADLPFGDPRRAHGVAMEGYYWRITDAVSGRVVVALCGACRAPDGPWALVALAAAPEGLLRWRIVPSAWTDPAGLGVVAAGVLRAGPDALHVDLGPDARLDVRLCEPVGWPRRHAFGGQGPAQVVPSLGQYWHPHVLGARVAGAARLGAEAPVSLDGATAYAEKNWGAAFAGRWWWGQAQGFAEAPETCVAFAGGRLRLPGGISAAPTAVVVRLAGEERALRLAPPLAATTAAVGRDAWRVRAHSAHHAVELEAEAAGATAFLLPVPQPAQRDVRLRSHQLLVGRLAVTVRRGRRVLFRGESRLAGLEREVPEGEAPDREAPPSAVSPAPPAAPPGPAARPR